MIMRIRELKLFKIVRNFIEIFIRKIHNRKMKIIKYNQILIYLIKKFMKLNKKEFFKNKKYQTYMIKLE